MSEDKQQYLFTFQARNGSWIEGGGVIFWRDILTLLMGGGGCLYSWLRISLYQSRLETPQQGAAGMALSRKDKQQ